jgi:hypothetical protein
VRAAAEKTIFDPAAACQPGEDDDRHDLAVSPWGQRASERIRRGVARLMGLIGLALVIALLARAPAVPAEAMGDRRVAAKKVRSE